MKKDFDSIIGSKLYVWAEKISVYIILSALWILFCVPVLTAGASTTALYYAVTKRSLKESESPARDFWHSFKDNLGQGIILHLIYSIYIALCVFNIVFANRGFGGVTLPQWYFPIAIILTLPVIFSYPFVFPCLARFKNSMKNTVVNSFALCFVNFPKFLALWLLLAVTLALLVIFPPLVLIVPALSCWVYSLFTEKVFAAATAVEENRGKEPSEINDEDEEDDSDDDENDEEDEDEEDAEATDDSGNGDEEAV